MKAVVNSINGELLELEIEPLSLVADLKSKVSEHWRVPAQCVKLTIGEQVLCDDQNCASLCGDSSIGLCIDMLISLDAVCQHLSDDHTNLQTKREALRILGSLGRRGGPVAIDAVRPFLEYQKTDVRLAAVDALQQLGCGDAHAIECASALLANRMEGVRQTGIRALAMLADEGDANAIKAVSLHLRQPNPPPVKAAALQALPKVARKGDEEIIALVSAFMLDEDSGVRFQAVQAIQRLAHRADKRAIAALIDGLDDVSWQVRAAAIRGLSALAEASEGILESLGEMLQDEVDMVRDEADEALSIFITKERKAGYS